MDRLEQRLYVQNLPTNDVSTEKSKEKWELVMPKARQLLKFSVIRTNDTSFPFMFKDIWIGFLSLMGKRNQANKSSQGDNACKELKIPGISKHSVNVGSFPCCFSYCCFQVFISKLEFLGETQDLEEEEITMVQFPYTKYNQRTEGYVFRSLSIRY